jgi:hypothetical protein
MDGRQLEMVRQLVLSTLTELGMPKAQWILVTDSDRERRQTRRDELLSTRGIRVVWELQKSQLSFYDEHGQLFTTIQLSKSGEKVGVA